MKKEIKSWGNYPKIKNVQTYTFRERKELKDILLEKKKYISYGYGRSYGDCALNEDIILTERNTHFINFDKKKGIIHCETGVLLADILNICISQGWFLYVTPGTKYITVGGAIASDVHGKNHHCEGSFSDWVIEFSLMLSDGEIKKCSKTKNIELFRATAGGMGLTGVIIDAKIQLKKIASSKIQQIKIKTENLKETIDVFKTYKDKTYSVAWIDCLAKGKKLGRSIVMLGEHYNDNVFSYQREKKLTIPFYAPNFVLNPYTVRAFNYKYYNSVKEKESESIVSLDSFFYPLDGINDWNKIYGKKGFTQFQMVIPEENGLKALEEILNKIAKSNQGSFLAVLKYFGEGNKNYLSFPMRGYTLALDFSIKEKTLYLLCDLGELLVKYNGRIYLSKDATVQRSVFEKGYDQVNIFRQLREDYHLKDKFQSVQSRRLEI